MLKQSMTAIDKQQAIRPLLNEKDPADALAAYYAFYHPAGKTFLVTYPPQAERATGYMAISRTGIDLFRPLVTLRLPQAGLANAPDLIYAGLPPGTAVILHAAETYLPVLQAFFDMQTVEHLHLFQLNAADYEPIINVLVTESNAPNGLPRFVIRSQANDNQIGASAALNWLSPQWGDIAVNTNPSFRRQGWGRSVVSAMANYLLSNGRTPLYVISADNDASRQLAQAVGFRDTDVRQILAQAILKPPR